MRTWMLVGLTGLAVLSATGCSQNTTEPQPAPSTAASQPASPSSPAASPAPSESVVYDGEYAALCNQAMTALTTWEQVKANLSRQSDQSQSGLTAFSEQLTVLSQELPEDTPPRIQVAMSAWSDRAAAAAASGQLTEQAYIAIGDQGGRVGDYLNRVCNTDPTLGETPA